MHEVEELLSAYVDDEISSDERMKVEEHLRTCESCQQQVQELTQMKQNISRAYFDVLPDDHFEALVMENISSYKEQLNRRKRRIHASVLIIGVALILFIFLQTSSALFAFFQVFFSFLHVSMSLIRAFVTIVSSVPTIIGTIVMSTVFVLIFSSWSIHRLLRTKTVVKEV
ncbi:anti-sigma factor family protein [Ectobacillus polymachus]|uniref:anti-sigma factor family protein n=1 Tax=Ectobacillus polymachus TaxID=1508806 RepID=UPI003A846130